MDSSVWLEQRTENPCVGSSNLSLNIKYYLVNRNFVDMFVTLKNGQLAKKKIVLQKRHTFCAAFLNLLWDEGFILGYMVEKQYFKIFLKYKNNKPVINSVGFITKPGNKIFYTLNQLWKLHNQTGLIIISTNRGLFSLQECKKYKIGGQPFVIIK